MTYTVFNELISEVRLEMSCSFIWPLSENAIDLQNISFAKHVVCLYDSLSSQSETAFPESEGLSKTQIERVRFQFEIIGSS